MKYKRIVTLAAITTSLIFTTLAFARPHYEVLHAFGKGTDGAGVWSSVASDSKGNLYGTTSGGGTYGEGTAFKLTATGNGHWTETLLHSFGKTDIGGCVPYGGPILDAAGNVYGTTVMCGPTMLASPSN